MRVCVLGTGVVGGILAACLLEKGVETWVVDASPERARRLREKGLSVRDPHRFIRGDISVRVPHLCASLDEAPRADVLFVCLKACVLKHVVADIRRYFQPGMAVVSFQNGLETEEDLAAPAAAGGTEAGLGRAQVCRVVVNYAGRLLDDGSVEVGFFQRPNHIGALESSGGETARRIAALLSGAGLDTDCPGALDLHVWEKVILNSAMSPLSALTGLTMREVMDTPELRSVVEGIAEEGVRVAQACGVAFPQGFLGRCIEYLDKGGRHKPSMLVDVEAGRETEIDFLNGRICARASRHGVPVPYNATIAALVRAIDANRRRPPYLEARARAGAGR